MKIKNIETQIEYKVKGVVDNVKNGSAYTNYTVIVEGLTQTISFPRGEFTDGVWEIDPYTIVIAEDLRTEELIEESERVALVDAYFVDEEQIHPVPGGEIVE